MQDITQELHDTLRSQLDLIIEGDPPAWLDQPVSVGLALNMQVARASIAEWENTIENIRQANGVPEIEEKIASFKESLLDQTMQFYEASGEKTVLFACGKVQYREGSESHRYDTSKVDGALAGLRAIVAELEESCAVLPDNGTEPENAALDSYQRYVCLQLEGIRKQLSQIDAAVKTSKRRASIALR